MAENVFTPTLRSLEQGQALMLHQDETLVYPKIFSDSYLQYREIWCMQYFNWNVFHTFSLVNFVTE